MKSVRLFFLVYLLLLSWGGLVYQTHQKNFFSKSVVRYWQESSILIEDLERFLADEVCYRSEKSFIACYSSLKGVFENLPAQVSKLDSQGFAKTFPQDPKGDNIESVRKSLQRYYSENKTLPIRYSFLKALREIHSKSPFSEAQNFILAQGINDFLEVAVDPHTYILPKKLIEESLGHELVDTVSAGFYIKARDKKYVVTRVLKKSSAFRKGVKVGDVLVAIDEKTTDSLRAYEVQDLLAGPSGRMTKFRFERAKKNYEVTLIRKWLKVSTVEYQKLKNDKVDVGYIRIFKFNVGTCLAFQQALVNLLEQNIKGLVLDLRDNPGGPIDESACIAKTLVSRGQFIVEAKDASENPQNEVYISDQDPLFTGPVAILVNSNSASSAEVLSGALQDNARAVIVGEKTYGKGTFQRGQTWGLHQDIAIFQTQGIIILPSGRTLQLKGIVPDVETVKNEQAKRESNSHFFPLNVADRFKTLSFESADFDVKCRILKRMSDLQKDIAQESLIGDQPVQKALSALDCLRQGLQL